MEKVGGGKIVIISLFGFICYLENYIIVGVLKVVVEVLICYLVVELVLKNIVVNVVSGGVVDIEVLKYFLNCDEFLDDVCKYILVGCMVELKDMVDVVMFLVFD